MPTSAQLLSMAHAAAAAAAASAATASSSGAQSTPAGASAGGVVRNTHSSSAGQPGEGQVVWQGNLSIITKTRNGLVRCRAERYSVPGGARIMSPFVIPSTIYLNPHRTVAGNTLIIKLRQPRTQWVLRFYAVDDKDAACVERLAAVLSERNQVVEVGLETGASLYLFGVAASSLTSGGRNTTDGHVLLAAYLPMLNIRPRQVRVKGVHITLTGFDSQTPVSVSVEMMRPYRFKKPSRNTAYAWPSVFHLPRTKFVERAQLPALTAMEAMWHVNLLPDSKPYSWDSAIAFVDAAQLAIELPTSDERWSLIITTALVDGFGLIFVGVHTLSSAAMRERYT